MGLKCLYEENGDSVKILRCYGECSQIVLPETISGRRVTELGDYIFSGDMRETPAGKLWEADEEPGNAAGTGADGLSGSAAGAGTGGLSGSAPGTGVGGSTESPGINTAELQAACGERLKEISLPSGIRKIGRYAFYNCYGLKKLSMYSTISDIGAGAFNGCRKIEELEIGVVKGERSCLKEVLAELNESLTVDYRQLEKDGDGQLKCTGRASLFFPVFYEEAVENTPARILETHVHGCGHRYRYAFDGTEFKFREYDSLFIHAKTQEPPARAAALAMGRLRFPLELTEKASLMYREYLILHPEEAAACLLKKDNMDEWRWFAGEFLPSEGGNDEDNDENNDEKRIKVEHATAGCLGNEGYAVRAREEYSDIKKPALGKTGFDKLIHASNRAGRTDVTSFLVNASYRAYPPQRKKFEL